LINIIRSHRIDLWPGEKVGTVIHRVVATARSANSRRRN
jgi:hypothetical protein